MGTPLECFVSMRTFALCNGVVIGGRKEKSIYIPSILLDLTALLLGLTLLVVEAVLLVSRAALPPVAVVTATVSTTATAATALEATASAGAAGLHAASLNVAHLLVAVVLLALDEQVLSLPLGLGVQGQESLLLLLRLELNEHTALEGLVVSTTQTDGVDGSVGGKEGLNVKLSGRLLVAETLGVDATAHGLVLEHLDHVVVVSLRHGLRKGSLPAHGGIVIGQLKRLGRLEGLDDGAEGLEAAHALEGVQKFQRNGTVGAAADLGEQELVHGQVGVREVELNLLADLDRVIRHLLRGGVKLGVVAAVEAALATPVVVARFLCRLLLFGLLRLLAQLGGGLDNAGFLGIFGLLLFGTVGGDFVLALQLGEDVLDILLSLSVRLGDRLLLFGHGHELCGRSLRGYRGDCCMGSILKWEDISQ